MLKIEKKGSQLFSGNLGNMRGWELDIIKAIGCTYNNNRWFGMLLRTVFEIFSIHCKKLCEILHKIDEFGGYFRQTY